MLIGGLDMQRISLGALIIALGMMVDNVIVVVEGTLVRTQKGENTRTRPPFPWWVRPNNPCWAGPSSAFWPFPRLGFRRTTLANTLAACSERS